MLICLTTAPARAAAPDAEPFRLAWSTTAGCGHAEAFLNELRARTSRLRPARAEERALIFVVETAVFEAGIRGLLTVQRPGADPVTREVPGSTCSEVTSAMALIAALMTDPVSSSAQREPNGSDAGTYRASNTDLQSPTWSLRGDHRLTARTAVAPSLAWGQGVGISLTREASWLHPSVAVAFLSTSSTTRASSGSAQFEWLAGQLTLCPVGLKPSEQWDIRACAGLELGRLKGTGFSTVQPASKAILWSSMSFLLQLRRHLLGPLWVGADGGLSLPFTREHFYLDPEPVLHRVPAMGVALGMGVGLRFL